jgi:hypothetical protein
VNIYDPADSIVYLHLASDPHWYPSPVVSGGTRNRLAPGQDQVAPYPPGETESTGHQQAPPAGGRCTHGNA